MTRTAEAASAAQREAPVFYGDMLGELPEVPIEEQVPLPLPYDQAPEGSETRKIADSIDTFSYSIMPGNSNQGFSLYGHTKKKIGEEEQDIISQYSAETVLPEAVWDTIKAQFTDEAKSERQAKLRDNAQRRPSSKGADDSQNQPRGYLQKVGDYSVLIYDETPHSNGAVFITKNKEGEFSNILTKAKDSFPALFNANMNHPSRDNQGEAVAFTEPPQYDNKLESDKRILLNDLFHDISANMSVTLANAEARNPDIMLSAQDLAPAVVVASSLQIDTRSHGLKINSDARDSIKLRLENYATYRTNHGRKLWMEAAQIDESAINAVIYRERQEASSLEPASSLVGNAQELTADYLVPSTKVASGGLFKWLGEKLVGAPGAIPIVAPNQEGDDVRQEISVPKIDVDQSVRPAQKPGWRERRKQARQHRKVEDNSTGQLPLIPSEQDQRSLSEPQQVEQSPQPERRLSRKRVAAAVGMLVTGAALGIAAYLTHKTGNDATSWVNNLSLPSFGGDKGSQASHLMEGLGHGNGPDGSVLANILPAPNGNLIRLGDSYIWDIAQANLSPDATSGDVYTETVRIMQANNLPIYPDAPDPLMAARSLGPDFQLFVPSK